MLEHCSRWAEPVLTEVMGLRTRKFVGVIATVVFMIVYSLVAMAVGAVWLGPGPAWLQLAYYIAAGLAWLPPVMVIIRWMSRPPEKT